MQAIIATDLGHIFCAVPKMFRDALEAEGWSMGRSTIHHSTISSDGTVKVRYSSPLFCIS